MIIKRDEDIKDLEEDPIEMLYTLMLMAIYEEVDHDN